jgi:hypothetical protein
MINTSMSIDTCMSTPHSILEETGSPPPAPAPNSSKKRRLGYRVAGSKMFPTRALPVGMSCSLFIPYLDESDRDSNGKIFLQPRIADSTSNHFNLLYRSSRHQDYNANSLPCPVPTLENEDEVKNNSKRSRPPSTTIRPKKNLLHDLEDYACCA